MLYTSAVEPNTLSLLKRLMVLDELKQFSLVGGTALSLRYGHRISVDLDLFSNQEFDQAIIIKTLESTFGNKFEYEGNFSSSGIFCFVNDIKVDIIHYPHSTIADIEQVEELRLYNSKDIAAMKIQAVLGRGKKKDFWDIAELLHHYSLNEIIDFQKQKFPSQQLLISIPQALTWFNDADESEDPVSLRGQTWESVKKTVQQKVNDYLK